MDAPRNYRSKAEAAAWLGISEPTLNRMLRERAIEYVRVGQRVRFAPEALEEYIARRVVPVNDLGPVSPGPKVRTKPGVEAAGHVKA